MKDALGHGSDGNGAASARAAPTPAAHQAGVEQLTPSLAEGRELYASLFAHARSVQVADSARDPKGAIAGRYNGGFSRQDLQGMIGGRDQGGSFANR